MSKIINKYTQVCTFKTSKSTTSENVVDYFNSQFELDIKYMESTGNVVLFAIATESIGMFSAISCMYDEINTIEQILEPITYY